ncbi:MAG: AbrB/MazE/SpoVT family DNA-binding domain-containing protein [Candidatus Anammoxibacter sp.]
MLTKLKKWGNSQGIRVPIALLEQSGISVEETVEISAKKGRIIIKPASDVKGKYNLKDLIDQLPADYKLNEIDWGNPVGNEEW